MKVSVITINYNNRSGLLSTIQSVINQTYDDFEFIIIDGGSTDGSKDVIEEYINKIDYWVSEPDSGIYNAMNKGINVAKGEYIHFLNSGDLYYGNDTLAKVFKNKHYSSPIIRGNYIADYGDRKEKKNNFGEKEVTIYDLYHQAFCHQAIFLAKSLFSKYGLYNEDLKFVADWEHTLRAILDGTSTEYINIDLAVYDMNGFSGNPLNQKDLLAERSNVLDKLLPFCIRKDYETLFNLEKKVNFSKHYYISNFVVAHKFPQFIFKILHKIYTTLGL